MFVLTPGKDLQVIAAGDHPTLGIGQELIGSVKGGLVTGGKHGS